MDHIVVVMCENKNRRSVIGRWVRSSSARCPTAPLAASGPTVAGGA
jgi:hypothetical protein